MTSEPTVAGHKVLRLLASGARSQVWLAAGDIVLKVLTPPVPVAAPGREAEALHRARGEHVVELLDVSLGAGGAVLVFPRLPRGSLAEVLSRRGYLDAGEAVTILAPIATCLTRLHSAGVAHAALTPDAVLFRADGAPMLTGFGHSELFEPGIPEVERERIAGVIADRESLRALADAVLARTTGARAKAASRLRDEWRDLAPGLLAERMAAELFELAAARPVRFEADEAEPDGHTGRVVAVAEAPVAEPAAEREGRIMPAIAVRLLDSGPASLVRDAVSRRWAIWSVRRRR
ncbi:MAG: protein kinase, partial [Rhodoglobus sp.]